MQNISKKKSEKEVVLNYSPEAIRNHISLMRDLDRIERYHKNCKIKKTTSTDKVEVINRKVIIKLLIATLRSTSREEREGMWEEVKYVIRAFNYHISFASLKKMVKMYRQHQGRLRAA